MSESLKEKIIKDFANIEIVDYYDNDFAFIINNQFINVMEKENDFEIYFKISLSHYDDIDNLRRNKKYYENIFIIAYIIFEKYNLKPSWEWGNCMGCPVDDLYLIYRLNINDLEYEKIKSIVNIPNEIKNFTDKKYKEVLKKSLEKFKDDKEHYEYIKAIINKEVNGYIDFLKSHNFNLLTEVAPEDFIINKESKVMIDDNKSMTIGRKEKIPNFIYDNYGKPEYKFDNLYVGINYLFGKKQDEILCIDMDNINLFKELLKYYKINKELSFFTNSENYVLVRCDTFWAIIMCMTEPEKILIEEYDSLNNLIKQFKPFAPRKKVASYDWTKLDESEFEDLCFDYLKMSSHFTDVKNRGKTNAPDGGVDIEATEIYETFIGIEKRKWIFQCKHTDKSIPRKDIAEIPLLLDEFDAKGYGLFCSGELSPQTIDRIKNMNKSNNTYIKFWTRKELEHELSRYPDLNNKYGIKIF